MSSGRQEAKVVRPDLETDRQTDKHRWTNNQPGGKAGGMVPEA